MARKRPLDKKRTYLKGLITRANKRIDELKKEGVYFQSFAVQDAIRTKSRAEGIDQTHLFSIEGLKTAAQLDKEKARLLAFLGNNTSRAEAAKYEYQKMIDAGQASEYGKRINDVNTKYAGKFFSKGLGAARHTDDIDEDTLRLAASIYRRIEEERANLIGKAAFDSQTLINMIYDEVAEMRYARFAGDDDRTTEHVLNMARNLLDEYQQSVANLRIFKKEFNFQKVGRRTNK